MSDKMFYCIPGKGYLVSLILTLRESDRWMPEKATLWLKSVNFFMLSSLFYLWGGYYLYERCSFFIKKRMLHSIN